MDKISAIQKLQEFKEQSGLGRDTLIDVYNNFRVSPYLDSVSVVYRGEIVKILHEEFWDYINTSDIREICTTGFVKISKDEEFENMVTKLRKEKLNTADKLRFERNITNKSLRTINTLEELNKEVLDSLRKLPKLKELKHEFLSYKDKTGIICISDAHFNELINTSNNQYDFNIASKRLKKLAIRSMQYFMNNNVTDIVIMFLGDMLNSDRRQSEIFNMATNRSRAMVLAFHLLRQFIFELSEKFNITIATVCGNESRVVGEEFDTSDILATYNYDYSIHEFLKVAFENNKNVKFIDGDFGEKILNINSSNILMTHGVGFKSDLEKSVQQTIGRYSASGINIDYVFCGHLHSCRIGDTCARCGSLCGGNSYSEGALNLNSRASQIIGIFYSDKTNEILRVDLQNVNNIEGYNIIDELMEYNVKSENKKNKFLVHNI